VSTHYDHVETAFSFRTRILDYLWVGLPIVTTGGDSFADLIADRPLGLTVPAEDVAALEQALFTLLDDAALRARCSANSVAVADELRWSKVLEPLVSFCREPRRAPDLLESVPLPGTEPTRPSWRDRGGLTQDVKIVKTLVTEGGLVLVVKKALGRVRRMAGRS
jgi:hypothetical protein